MTAQGKLNHWRAEAAKLPAPSMIGEWIVSPGGVRFDVVGYANQGDSENIHTLAWVVRVPSGQMDISFRQTRV